MGRAPAGRRPLTPAPSDPPAAPAAADPPVRVRTRNADFQQWQALLTNRAKRTARRELLIQGVRPINQAVEHGWPVRELLVRDGQRLSAWAEGIRAGFRGRCVLLAPELMEELGERSDGPPELILVAEQPPDDPGRLVPRHGAPVVALDRPSSPGNLGTVLRSADAFEAAGVLVTGHAADPYDPKSVRASTGSLFALPVVRLGPEEEVEGWVEAGRRRAPDLLVVGTDEGGEVDVRDAEWWRPTVLVVGNEGTGMSRGWRARCDLTVRIPMGGSASSLNAATAASILLYEARRSRRG